MKTNGNKINPIIDPGITNLDETNNRNSIIIDDD